MKRSWITSIDLLMISLQVLIFASLCAAVADNVDTIRLPSDGKDLSDEVMAAITSGGEERPWRCCDDTLCLRMYPPVCRCTDRVKKCDSACKNCEKVESDSSRHVCMDWYQVLDYPVPKCSPRGEDHRGKAAAAADGVDTVRIPDVVEGLSDQVMAWMLRSRKNGDEKRPWKCCDLAACTRSIPPICHCFDMVKHCGSGCKQCEHAKEEDGSDSSRYICRDKYIGDPGPRCGKHAAFGLPGGN